jgi:uncharacterized membrane protein
MRPAEAELQLIHKADERARQPLDAAERRAELLIGGGAAVATVALWLLPSTGHWSVGALACVIAMLAAAAIRIDVAGGYTMPTQLCFLPLMFTVPANALPAVVIGVLALSRVPDVLRAKAPPARLLLSFANGWFAIGPAIVLVLLGGPETVLRHPLYATALLGAQVASDFAASTLREAIIRDASVTEQLRGAAWVYGFDIALTPAPVWLTATTRNPVVAAAILLPTLALVRIYAIERRRQIDALLQLTPGKARRTTTPIAT